MPVRVLPTLTLMTVGICGMLAGCATQDSSSGSEQPVTPLVPSENGQAQTRTERIPETAVEFDLVWVAEGGFWIGKTEVTWDEFLIYCAFDEVRPEGRDAESRPSKPLEVAPPDRHWGYGKQPAVGMSWNSAKKYCEWLSAETGRKYRLPTETEWRLACGDAGEDLGPNAWIVTNSDGQAHPVGLKEPNALGLHDTLGNLWEYCANPYDPEQPKRAVLRGGSWKDAPKTVTPDARLRFDNRWTLKDPSFPPGVWWVPDGDHLGMRVLCEGEAP